jgi:hypothetical protein
MKRGGDASSQRTNKKPRVGEECDDAFTQVLATAGAIIKGETVVIGIPSAH